MPKKRKGNRNKGGKVRSRTAAPARTQKSAVASVSGANGAARLIFPPSFQEEGFTSADIAQFNNKDIPSAVRELIQNSLDAATEIGRRPAIARFSVEHCPLDAVPGLAEYKTAFESARQRAKPDGQQADIIADIAEGLEAKTAPFLFVEDNGVGLDPRRMDALNGDGVNVKGGEQAIGSYGNGHLTVFSLSRLRYILYGGVTKSGDMTASGHAILASHTGQDGLRASRHGFYAVKLSDREGVTSVFPQNEKIHPFLKSRLAAIRDEFNSGSVVAVPGFNHFGGEMESIAEEVMKAAALSFFPAIHEGNLEVRILENGAETTLTKAGLANYIDKQSAETRSSVGGFPSGAKAAASYRTMREGVEHSVPVDGGSVRLLLRQGPENGVESTRVTFCRNGMWITDRVGMLRGQFAEKTPFDALLLANMAECKKFHNLMEKAEGRLHIELEVKRLHKKHKPALRAGFRAIRDFLLQNVADSETEMFEPSDFYQIETGQAVGGGKPPSSSAMRGKAKAVPGTFTHAVAVKGKRKGKKSAQQKRRGGNTMIARTMAKRVGANTMEIGVDFHEDCDNCELQMTLDNGTDPSCTNPLGRKPLYIHAASVGGGGLDLVGGENKRVGAMLGGAKAGDRRIVRVEFESGQLSESGLHVVACEFYRRAAGSAGNGGGAQ